MKQSREMAFVLFLFGLVVAPLRRRKRIDVPLLFDDGSTDSGRVPCASLGTSRVPQKPTPKRMIFDLSQGAQIGTSRCYEAGRALTAGGRGQEPRGQ